MKEKNRKFFGILLRYSILILTALPNLFLFYLIFTPLTAYPVYWLLSIFHDASLLNNDVILINQAISIELIEACIAGSAYYLLLILNLSTPGIKLNRRIKIIALSFLIFLVVNVFRIFILSLIAVSGSSFILGLFDITHWIFWYALSTIFVVAIWFAEVRIFRIKEIPFYSDIKFLYKNTK
ncbi:MAG: pacearchaeosortase [Nanoarchaeota archaeon]|nr:pacearchaeosortase [Nanoarchaeota archaeon]